MTSQAYGSNIGTHQVTATWGKCTFDGPWTEQGRNPKAEGITHTPKERRSWPCTIEGPTGSLSQRNQLTDPVVQARRGV
ncbi:hypothetical protein WI0192307A02_CDS0082 [Pseudomonas phage KG853]